MKVAALVVTWNSAETIGRCLVAAAGAARSTPLELHVWDNASGDLTSALALAHVPDHRVVRSPANVGFARAVNELAARTDADALLLLNPDAYLEAGAIDRLAAAVRDGAAIAGGRLSGPGGEVQPACARPYPSAWRLAWWLATRRRPSWRIPTASAEVDAVSGAFMLVSRAAWDAAAGLDTAYPHSGEDLDLCWRVKQSGGCVVFVPAARAVHELEASVRQAPAEIDVLRWLGTVRFARRKDGRAAALALRATLALQTSALLLARAFRLPAARGRDVVRAGLLWRWAVLNAVPPLPSTVKERP